MERRRPGGMASSRGRAVHALHAIWPARSPTSWRGNGVVAWFDGRSEFGPRALGQRSLIAHPGHPENLERLNDVKGREQFRPVAPMVLLDHAADIFTGGPIPSPYMLFVHDVKPQWRQRIPAAVHVDGTARIQTVDPPNPAAAGRDARGVQPTDRAAGGDQHQPEHRRPADGGRPARCAGTLRVRAGRSVGAGSSSGPARRAVRGWGDRWSTSTRRSRTRSSSLHRSAVA